MAQTIYAGRSPKLSPAFFKQATDYLRNLHHGNYVFYDDEDKNTNLKELENANVYVLVVENGSTCLNLYITIFYQLKYMVLHGIPVFILYKTMTHNEFRFYYINDIYRNSNLIYEKSFGLVSMGDRVKPSTFTKFESGKSFQSCFWSIKDIKEKEPTSIAGIPDGPTPLEHNLRVSHNTKIKYANSNLDCPINYNMFYPIINQEEKNPCVDIVIEPNSYEVVVEHTPSLRRLLLRKGRIKI